MATNIPKKIIDDKTLDAFNNTASFTKTIPSPSSEFETTLGFFLKFSGNHAAARSLTTDFIRQSKINNFDVQSLILELQGLDGLILNSALAAVFNSGREKTSILGFRQDRVGLNPVKRTVIP